MTKDKPTIDSADYLARRQGDLLRTILQGIQDGGLDDETWLQIYAERMLLANRGYTSKRAQAVLHIFNTHQFYKNPRRLSQLVKHLIEEFNAIQRIYINKGWVQLAPTEETVQYESTLNGESPSIAEIKDWINTNEE